MAACNVDSARLTNDLSEFLENDMDDLIIENLQEAKPTAGFQRVVHRAAVHAQASGKHHFIPVAWVDHVDAHVHLNKSSRDVTAQWQTAA